MFINIAIVLARAKSPIFLFDKEKVRGLRRVGQTNLSRGEIFVKEVFGGLSFFRGKGIHLPYFWGEGVVEVDLMVIGSRRGNMVGGLFGEYRSERRVFWGKCRFGFGLLCCSG